MVLFVTIKSSIELTLGELSLSCMAALLTLLSFFLVASSVRTWPGNF